MSIQKATIEDALDEHELEDTLVALSEQDLLDIYGGYGFGGAGGGGGGGGGGAGGGGGYGGSHGAGGSYPNGSGPSSTPGGGAIIFDAAEYLAGKLPPPLDFVITEAIQAIRPDEK